MQERALGILCFVSGLQSMHRENAFSFWRGHKACRERGVHRGGQSMYANCGATRFEGQTMYASCGVQQPFSFTLGLSLGGCTAPSAANFANDDGRDDILSESLMKKNVRRCCALGVMHDKCGVQGQGKAPATLRCLSKDCNQLVPVRLTLQTPGGFYRVAV